MLPLALLDASGSTVASYTYDPNGKVLSAEGTMAETNPLRYRGYYYDAETGLYYLQSRYYDPATCRFVNADNAAVIAVSPEKANWDKNLFAYCDNDPVNRKDDGGELWASCGRVRLLVESLEELSAGYPLRLMIISWADR